MVHNVQGFNHSNPSGTLTSELPLIYAKVESRSASSQVELGQPKTSCDNGVVRSAWLSAGDFEFWRGWQIAVPEIAGPYLLIGSVVEVEQQLEQILECRPLVSVSKWQHEGYIGCVQKKTTVFEFEVKLREIHPQEKPLLKTSSSVPFSSLEPWYRWRPCESRYVLVVFTLHFFSCFFNGPRFNEAMHRWFDMTTVLFHVECPNFFM